MIASTAVSDALFVLDGARRSPESARSATRVLGDDVRWSIVSVIAEHPRFTSGATGFASPILSESEMDARATEELIAGDAAAAATAGGFGDRPVTQAVVRGEVVAAVTRYVDRHPVDLVVVESTDVAAALLDGGLPAVLVVAPTND
ncbi:MAG: hypothetical protein ABJH68_00375 [Ilumatobacter sp.]|uniref:hypothetical protein n=1 Tax=Ilumatobacter sp. TaxID=1967498 RepID=UPI003299FF11